MGRLTLIFNKLSWPDPIRKELDQLRLREGDERLDYQLVPVGAPRFWQPNEPVVLFCGKDARPAHQPSHLPVERPDPNGPEQLICRLSNAHGATAASPVDPLVAEAKVRLRARRPGGPGSYYWSQSWSQPWRPLMMQWEVEFHPAVGLTAPDYAPDYVVHHTGFDEKNPNELKFAPSEANEDPDRYRGSVLLTSNAEINIVEHAKVYLRTHPAVPDDAKRTQVRVDLSDLLELPSLPLQSQALSGFNAALLARRQSIQLPVIDPHAKSSSDFKLGLRIGGGVGDKNDAATLTNVDLNPMRSGHMELKRLWLIDAFGQVVVVLGPHSGVADWENPHLLEERNIIRSQSLVACSEGPPNPQIALRPRLVQPARLLFCWRSAQDDQVEMNSHPASTPIFGWILANHLEDSLALYDQEGNALGSFNMLGELWQGAPGPFYEHRIEEIIPEGHLRDFAIGITEAANDGQARKRLRALIDAIDDMIHHVLPQSSSQHQGLSVLIGRPLALVRASVGLELLGQPAADQSLDAFAQWVNDGTRATRGLEKLQFPVRLGQKGHLNDGLIGYFIERAQKKDTYGSFYVEDYSGAAGQGVQVAAFDQLTVTPGPEGKPERLITMLIDPRAPVHATAGILPVKQVEIPSNMVADAIRRMAVSFPITPVFAPIRSLATAAQTGAGIDLPAPAEPGYEWSFLRHSATTPRWTEVAVNPVNQQADFSTHPQQMLDGWLQLRPAPSASTNPKKNVPSKGAGE